jgi:predicted molibdopterin-dependent oxidoreductase YjgC
MPDVSANVIVALPSTNVAEEEGTFTNLRGRVQQYRQARQGPGMAHPVWWSVGDVLVFLGERAGYTVSSEAFAALAAARPEFAGLSYETLGARGQLLVTGAQPAETAR